MPTIDRSLDFEIGNARVLCGDALTRLRELPDKSVHSCVTDPPYDLGFMGKAWDKSGVAFRPEVWVECLRVLKPGGFLLAFGGTRTYHRMACAIEDAGFEIRDQMQWLYGSGFPKSLDVSKAIDKMAGAKREVVGVERMKRMASPKGNPGSGYALKQPQISHEHTVATTDEAKTWDGWGTALKPAHEPICVARKPFSGSVAENVLAHGCGALNIDGCRIEGPAGSGVWGSSNKTVDPDRTFVGSPDAAEYRTEAHPQGRWPSNVILDEAAGEMLDLQAGISRSVKLNTVQQSREPRSKGAERERIRIDEGYEDFGGASRFFYCAKASQSERGQGNDHPTVKPIALMRYLVRLVTPPAGIVLDPFVGSGTTGLAALIEGFGCVLCELLPDHIGIIRARLGSVTPGMVFD